MNHRSGSFKTNLCGEAKYQSFVPAPLPPDPPVDLDDEGIHLLAHANWHLGILSGISSRIPNINLFVSMYVRKEALLSSQIEGTQATLDDILDPAVEKNTNQNITDVINYIRAVEYGVERLKELPLCGRLLRELHAILMEGGRGQEKTPGEFRASQNWIGGIGSTLKTASYIPPHPEEMAKALSDLEKFINAEDDLDVLVKTALIHYQFETIHPFLDGNGRVGRMLITLFLLEKGLLQRPVLYMSYFLKLNRVEYFDRLTEVRRKGNYEQWVKFFLRALCDTAEDTIETIDRMIELHDRNLAVVSSLGKVSGTAVKLLAYLEASPIIEIKRTAEGLGLSYNAVANAVRALMEKGILVQTEKKGRTRKFAYEEYLRIMRKDT